MYEKIYFFIKKKEIHYYTHATLFFFSFSLISGDAACTCQPSILS